MHAPMKTAFLIVIISLAILSPLTFLISNIYAGETTIEIISSPTAFNSIPPFQRSSFNAWNRSWVFVCLRRDGYDILTYSSSTDESTWVNAYDDNGEPPLITTWADSWLFDVHFYHPYVHLAISTGDSITYRRGLPLANSSIIWGNTYTVVTEPASYWGVAYPKICADTNNYVWVGWENYYSYFPNYDVTPYVTKSSTNDGTWVTASGFPYKLAANKTGQAEDFPPLCVIPLCLGIGGQSGKGDTYVIYGDRIDGNLKGRLWNGAWGSEETITTTLGGYGFPAVSAISSFSFVSVAWSNSSKDLLFRERNYLTLWQDVELIADAKTEEIYNATVDYPQPVISIDGDLTIHAFWIGTRDYPIALAYKNRTVTPTAQWNDFEILSTNTQGQRTRINCREKALNGIVACTWHDVIDMEVDQWALDWEVTDWGDYEPPPANPLITGWIQANGVVDTTGLEFTLGDETYTHGHGAYFLIGNYTLNATSCLDDPAQHPFVSWASLPQNPIQNTTNPITNITISISDTITLTVQCLNETCPHQHESINISIRIDGQPPPYNFDGVLIDGGAYRDGETVGLLNGTYELNAYLAGGYGFLNWATTDAGGEHYFGNKTIGGYNTTTAQDYKLGAYGTSYNLDRRANITKIWFYCWASADVQKGTCGIYSIEGYDLENAVLMGETQELTGINTTAMWRNFTFTGGLLLEAGDYVLTVHAGGETAGLRGKYDAETGSHFQGVTDTYSDGLSNPFGSGGSNISNCYVSIYAEYTYDLLYVHNKSEQTTFLTVYGDGTLTLNLYELPDLTNLYTWIVLLLAALFLMIWSPSWVAWGIKKRGVTPETIERLGYGMLLFLVGFGLLVMWLYS